MNQYLVLTIVGNYAQNLLEKISKAIHDHGGGIVECRYSKMGNELSGQLMVEGGWDAISRIETLVPKLQQELELKIHSKRTERTRPAGKTMPYGVDIVGCYRPGLLYEINRFISEHEIETHDLYTSNNESPQTGTRIFTLHMTVGIPVSTSISHLRGEFMEFCDSLNLDAIMEPVK